MTIGIILFSIGGVGLVLFSIISTIENARGARFFNNHRVALDRTASRVYRILVFGEIPHTYRQHTVAYIRRSVHNGVNALIMMLRALEKPLARMSVRMRRSQDVRLGARRAPSPFLKDISPQENQDKK